MAPSEDGPAVADGTVALPPNKARKGQVRRLIGATQPQDPSKGEPLTELDRERAELMRRNAEMLAKFGVGGAIRTVRTAAAEEQAVRCSGEAGPSGRGGERPAPRPKRARVEVGPTRRSSRLAGGVASEGAADALEGEEGEPRGKAAATGKGVGIMTQEEYLASKGMPLPEGHFRTDGRYTGWVAPHVVERFGLASSAAEAWEQGGGGAFKRRITKADIPAHLRANGWSNARAFAASQLHKNPNAYFYRHTAPGEQQAQGAWSEEEHRLFVETARKFGVGDKWGLFASYIPNRLGYQCSQYYTQVIIPSGLILDSRFRIDAWGDAVFVGTKDSD